MNKSLESSTVADVSFDEDSLSVRLKDGRTISVPLTWYPRLFHATTQQRLNWKVAGGGYGIHWPISTKTLAPRACFGERLHRNKSHQPDPPL